MTMQQWLSETFRDSYLSEEARDYLLARGALSNTIEEMGVVTFLPPASECPIPEFATKFGKHFEFFEGKLMFPIYSPMGALIGFDSRSVEAKDLIRFHLKEASWNPVFHGMPKAMHRIWKGADIWIVEGVFDLFALEHILPDCAIIGVGPAHLNFKHLEFLRRWKNHVNLCLDQDDAGRRGMKKAFEDLQRWKISCRMVAYGKTGDDPGAIWTRGGVKSLQESFKLYL